MNKSEFVAAVAEKTTMTKKEVQTVLDACLEEITKLVAAGDEISFIGFGSFKSAKRAAREGRNPATGETMKIPASVVPKFVPGKGFKEAVNAAAKKTAKKKVKK